MLKGQANIIYNQIWLNLPMDDRNFGYKTKLTQKKKKKTRLQSNEKEGSSRRFKLINSVHKCLLRMNILL
jgi:hypothetical protein